MVAWLPAHSGQFVIAVQGAIVDFSTILFIQDKSAIQCVCAFELHLPFEKNRCWRNIPLYNELVMLFGCK